MKKICLVLCVLLIINIFIYKSDTAALEYNKITVDIKGAVKNPGVYDIEVGTTTYDLIKLAGGLKSYADTSLINLSKKLNDEDVVIIYTIDEVASLTSGDRSVKVVETECMCPKISNVSCISNSSKININEASIDELTKLNGIGKSKAEAIVEYRKNNHFNKPEDIMNVKGIGKSLYEKNKDLIGV